MIGIKVRIENLAELQRNFAKAPQVALQLFSKATKASIFEIEKQAIDANFQFKWPRSMRTGYLALSFAYGRYFHPSGLSGSIGPTAHYAPYVYNGTRRGQRANPYMDRIADAASRFVSGHFEKAGQQLVDHLAKV